MLSEEQIKYNRYILQCVIIKKSRILLDILLMPTLEVGEYQVVRSEAYKSMLTCHLIALFGNGRNDKISLLKSDILEVKKGAENFILAYSNEFDALQSYRDKVCGHIDDDNYKIKASLSYEFINECIKALNQLEYWIKYDIEKHGIGYKEIERQVLAEIEGIK